MSIQRGDTAWAQQRAHPTRLMHSTAQVETVGQTGGKTEALMAVQIGLLTIYDMCKAGDRGMVMTDIRVMEKQAGKRGEWRAESWETESR